MAISYLDAVRQGFPTVMCITNGDPFIYNSLEWTGGDALPSQDDLDTWITENPGWNPTMELSKYQFRQLFTMNEKVAIDCAQSNVNIPQNYKNILTVVMKDLELSDAVHLDNPAVAAGVAFLAQLGLIATGRVAEIMSNTPHA